MWFDVEGGLEHGDAWGARIRLRDPVVPVVPEPEFHQPVSLVRAEVAYLAGNTILAAEQADLAIAYYRDRAWPPRHDAWAQLGIAQAQAWSGHYDDAVRDASAALAKMKREDAFVILREMMSGACGMTPGQVRRDPFWSRLADDPRFEEILENAKP